MYECIFILFDVLFRNCPPRYDENNGGKRCRCIMKDTCKKCSAIRFIKLRKAFSRENKLGIEMEHFRKCMQ